MILSLRLFNNKKAGSHPVENNIQCRWNKFNEIFNSMPGLIELEQAKQVQEPGLFPLNSLRS
jgi:hypothetical protein